MIRVLTENDRQDWDDFVSKNLHSGFMQSWDWSCFKELEGYKITRLGVFEQEKLIGGMLAYSSTNPNEINLMAIPDGPVLNWESMNAHQDFLNLVEEIKLSSQAEKVITLRIEPRLLTPPQFFSDFPRSPVDLVPKETLEITLGSEEEMLSVMKPKGRYNIRLSERHGVKTMSSTDPSDVHQFYDILTETAKRQKFVCEPKSFFINLVQSIFPKMGSFEFASYQEKILAAALISRFGNTVTYLYGGHVEEMSQVMANYGLHWHIMREATKEGYKKYDLFGYVAPGTPDHPYDRFSRFKEKLGGTHLKRIGSRDIIFFDRMADIALKMLNTLSLQDSAKPVI